MEFSAWNQIKCYGKLNKYREIKTNEKKLSTRMEINAILILKHDEHKDLVKDI